MQSQDECLEGVYMQAVLSSAAIDVYPDLIWQHEH